MKSNISNLNKNETSTSTFPTFFFLTALIIAALKTCCILLLSNGTSMISLIIPPKDQISRVAKMLADEFGTASNIKSRVNRLSVLGAITSVQQRLKLYNKGKHMALLPFTVVSNPFRFSDYCTFCVYPFHNGAV